MPFLIGGKIKQKDKRRCALDMSQESKAEPLIVMGVFNDAGNIRDQNISLWEIEDAEIGTERREWIRRNLHLDVSEAGEQGRFAGIRHADKPDIGDQLELQFHFAGLARGSICAKVGSLVGRGLETGI